MLHEFFFSERAAGNAGRPWVLAEEKLRVDRVILEAIFSVAERVEVDDFRVKNRYVGSVGGSE